MSKKRDLSHLLHGPEQEARINAANADLFTDRERGIFPQLRASAILDKVHAEKILRGFFRNYSSDKIRVVQTGQSGTLEQRLGSDPTARMYPLRQRHQQGTSVFYTIGPTVTEKSGQMKTAGLNVGIILGDIEPNGLTIGTAHGLGNDPDETVRNMQSVLVYHDTADKRIPYRKIRRRIRGEMNKFVREKHIVKTPEAIRRDLRKRGAAGIAVISAIGTGVKFGNDIVQFAQHTLPNLPIPFVK